MSVAELKEVLHEGIENLQDTELLELIKSLIDQQYRALPVPTLSEERRKQLEISRQESAKQLTLSSEESDRQIDKWLNPVLQVWDARQDPAELQL